MTDSTSFINVYIKNPLPFHADPFPGDTLTFASLLNNPLLLIRHSLSTHLHQEIFFLQASFLNITHLLAPVCHTDSSPERSLACANARHLN